MHGMIDPHIWFQPVQIRRQPRSEWRDGWSEMGHVMPLSEAIRLALKMLEREPVTIQFVHPRPEAARLDESDILYLARCPDYPLRASRAPDTPHA